MPDTQQYLDWLDSQAQLTQQAKGQPLSKEDRRGIVQMFRDTLPEGEREAIFDEVVSALAKRNGK